MTTRIWRDILGIHRGGFDIRGDVCQGFLLGFHKIDIVYDKETKLKEKK